MLGVRETAAVAAALLAVGLVWLAVHHLQGVRADDRYASRLGRGARATGQRLDAALRRLPGLGLVARRLEENHVRLRLSRLLLVWVVVAYPSFLLLRSPFGTRMAIVLLVFGIPLATVAVLGAVAHRRRERLRQQVVDLVRYLAGAARAGLSVSGALRSAAEEFPAPLGPELDRLGLTMEFGELPAEALDELRHRVRLPETHLLVDALVIQQRSGGDLVSLLSRLAAGMESIARGRRQAEGIVAALRTMPWTVLLLALLLLMSVNRISDGLLDRLHQWPLVEIVVYACLALIVASIPVISRVVRLESRG